MLALTPTLKYCPLLQTTGKPQVCRDVGRRPLCGYIFLRFWQPRPNFAQWHYLDASDQRGGP